MNADRTNDMIGSAMKLMRLAAWLFACAFLPGMATADVITYYHNDLLGSPIVATDQTGAVVWRETFVPYGERMSPTLKPNKVWYTSRVQDDDTRLVYMGARHYDPITGRFISADPVGYSESNLHSFNRYAYGNNNPMTFVDRNGAWAIYIHKESIQRVLAFLPGADILALQRQQDVIDFFQGNDVQYKHALRIPGQKAEEAWTKANDFVRNEIELARGLEDAGYHQDALRRLSNAIHTMQDSTSPSHAGFQEWDNDGPRAKKAAHLWEDFPDPGAGSALDNMTSRAWALFRSREALPQQILPKP